MAFANCTSLEKITFPDSLKFIGNGSFCLSDLKNIVIPASVEIIDDHAFSACDSLENVKIESGVKTLGREAFAGCNNLTNVEIPASVDSIGSRVFSQSENVVISAPSGSAAETYANENEIEFKVS